MEGRKEKRSSGLKCSRRGFERWKTEKSADDVVPDLQAEATKAELLAVMEWHVFSEAELGGVFTP